MTAARVLHVSAVDFTASKLLRPQLSYLRDKGYDVRVACGRTDDVHWASLADFKPYDLAFPRALKPQSMFASSMRLRSFVHVWTPDILHLHTPAASLPVRALPRRLWPRGMKIVYTVHGYLHRWPPAGPRERIVQLVEQMEAGWTDLTLFQSREDLHEALARGYGGRPSYLGNGVEDAWFDTPLPRRDREDLSLLFVGRMVAEKGILDLLRAVEQTPNVYLHIAGDALPSDRDSVATEVRAFVEDRLAGRVRIHGMLTQAALRLLYEEVDALCLPSYREGVPRSVIEALASGRPVVGSRIRGTRELVRHGWNGLLFEVGDAVDLSRQLGALCSLSERDFGAMAAAARESVDPSHRESQVFRRLVDSYGVLL